MVVWQYCFYHYSTWSDPQYKNVLLLSPFTAELFDLDASSTLKDWFTTFGSKSPLPTLTNSVYHRALINRVKSRVPRLIPVFAGDIFSAVLILSEVRNYCYVDSPLIFFGRSKESTASSLFLYRGSTAMKYLEEFPEEKNLQHVPLKMLTMTNFIADALLGAKKAVGNNLSKVELNWELYFVGCYGDLMGLRKNGVDISKDLEEFCRVLAQQPLNLQERVRTAIALLPYGDKNFWKRMIRYLINSSPVLTRLELLLRPQENRRRLRLIRGEEAGFSNILECARRFDAILSNGFAHCRYGSYVTMP
jgi:hypothetical protein